MTMTEREPYQVIEIKGWSYIEGPFPTGVLDGPWRYRWEAQEEADRRNGELGTPGGGRDDSPVSGGSNPDSKPPTIT